MFFARLLMASLASALPSIAVAADVVAQGGAPVARSGITGLWVLANFSYAGMRAQNSQSAGWRILAFIFGFPGTLITFFAVSEGSERAYGVQLPRKRPPDDRA